MEFRWPYWWCRRTHKANCRYARLILFRALFGLLFYYLFIALTGESIFKVAVWYANVVFNRIISPTMGEHCVRIGCRAVRLCVTNEEKKWSNFEWWRRQTTSRQVTCNIWHGRNVKSALTRKAFIAIMRFAIHFIQHDLIWIRYFFCWFCDFMHWCPRTFETVWDLTRLYNRYIVLRYWVSEHVAHIRINIFRQMRFLFSSDCISRCGRPMRFVWTFVSLRCCWVNVWTIVWR